MARTARNGSRGRQALDARLDQLRPAVPLAARPSGGWIRAIRESLGMSLDDFAARLDVTKSTASRMEASERDGRIQLDTLARAANALDCDVVVALVPRGSLEEAVRTRARKLAAVDLAVVQHTMTLENQGLDEGDAERLVDDLAADLMDRPGLWREPATPMTWEPLRGSTASDDAGVGVVRG